MPAYLGAAVLARTGDWAHGGLWDGGWLWVWRLGMLLIWIALAGLGYWFGQRSGQGSRPDAGERARDILAERLARGEIGVEEYRQRLEQLS